MCLGSFRMYLIFGLFNFLFYMAAFKAIFEFFFYIHSQLIILLTCSWETILSKWKVRPFINDNRGNFRAIHFPVETAEKISIMQWCQILNNLSTRVQEGKASDAAGETPLLPLLLYCTAGDFFIDLRFCCLLSCNRTYDKASSSSFNLYICIGLLSKTNPYETRNITL